MRPPRPARRGRRCPSCSAELDAVGAVCNACGAGLPTLSAAPPAVALTLGWAFTVATVALPFLWLEVVSLRAYALGFVVYLAAAKAFTPSFDLNDMGLFGRWGPDNPFRFADDRNRAGLALALLLFPGKLVWWTLALSWALLGRR